MNDGIKRTWSNVVDDANKKKLKKIKIYISFPRRADTTSIIRAVYDDSRTYWAVKHR